MKTLRRTLPFLLLTAILVPALAQTPPAKAPERKLPFPGEVFPVEGCTAFVILPPEVVKDQRMPWVWYAPTLPAYPGEAEKWMFEKFLAAGIAIAGIDVGESYGSPQGRERFSALYKDLTEKRGFAKKPVLLARSRGGLMHYAWACENPDKVGGIAGIYPVCDLSSYPGMERASGAYKVTAQELKAQLAKHNPVERLEGLAKHKVPLFHIHGDVDKVVPLDKNSGAVAQRYKALDGKMTLVVPPGQGHNMWPGFFRCQALVDFVLSQARP